LFEGGCEIWIASIPEFTEHQAALDGVLTPDERAHVHRTRGGRATARLSRGLLRLVLAHYLNLPPAEIEIDRSCPDCGRPHGRPRLRRRPETAIEAIEFSVTHGGDLLVLAFAGNAPVGVDVEPIGALEDVCAELLDFTLTAAERLRLLEVPAPQRRRIFLRHWTGKEAILKALGTGLDVEPQAVTLPPFPIKGKASVTLPGSPPVDLWIRNVEVGPAHVCTLATGQEVRELRLARLSPSFLLGRSG
jgi:4'-phosphopantetheinyl transferase